MIILQTGVPGSGKTANVVHLLMMDKSYTRFEDKDGVVKQRPLFVNGLPELQIEHQELTDDQVKDKPLQDFLPYGSLVVIDEAQRLMGTRSAAKQVPEYIEAMAMHRHHGLDIILITQHPSFLDAFVRKLVQRHLHISIKPIGRKIYEWNECVDQPDARMNIDRAIEKNFSPPKKAFGQYKSAEVHTKPKRAIPKSLVFLMLLVPALLWFGLRTYSNLSDRYGADDAVTADVAAESVHIAASPPAGSFAAVSGQSLSPDMYVPTIPEKPESKPLYDGVRQVQTFERIVACISGGKSGCSCYSGQGTKLKEVSDTQCRDYVDNGLPFDPYRQDRQIEHHQDKASASVDDGGA